MSKPMTIHPASEATMKIARFILFAGMLIACAAAKASLGDDLGLRCNGDIAEVGDFKASVIMKCGYPFFAETICKPAGELAVDWDGERTGLMVWPCFPVDEWSYNPGSGQFLTIMRFEGGVLTSIRYGSRIP
jgi:hypothetical protein